MSDPVFRDPPRTGRGNPGVSRPGRVSRPTARQPNRGLTDDSPEFTCTVCREVKPMAEAHTVGAGGGKRRRTGWCSECGPKKVRENADNWIAKKRGPDYVLPAVRDQINPIIDGTRKCWTCEVVKPIEDFYVELSVASGRQSICNVCFSARKRIAHILRTYNITEVQYNKMLADQDGVCAICKHPETAKRKSHRETALLSVDHDHACCSGNKSCGKCVRGLICHLCNAMLGYARDDVELLQAAVVYLTTHARVPTDTPWADPDHDVLGDIQSYMREASG